jgi:hypothetical protein
MRYSPLIKKINVDATKIYYEEHITTAESRSKNHISNELRCTFTSRRRLPHHAEHSYIIIVNSSLSSA